MKFQINLNVQCIQICFWNYKFGTVKQVVCLAHSIQQWGEPNEIYYREKIVHRNIMTEIKGFFVTIKRMDFQTLYK